MLVHSSGWYWYCVCVFDGGCGEGVGMYSPGYIKMDWLMIHIYSPMQLHSSIIITPMQCIGAMQLHCCFPYIIVYPKCNYIWIITDICIHCNNFIILWNSQIHNSTWHRINNFTKADNFFHSRMVKWLASNIIII